MRTRNVYIVAICIFLFLYLVAFAVGTFLSENCVAIGTEKACWKSYPSMVTSNLCPKNQTQCRAEPELQQNNAIVQLILDSCQKAKAGDYSDSSLNSDIERVVNGFTNYTVSVTQICNDPGLLLTFRKYE